MKNNNKLIYGFLTLGLIGFADALYLTVSHYTGDIACSVISGCQEVLVSPYSEIFGLPIALFGAAYYLFIFLTAVFYLDTKHILAFKVLGYLPIIAFVFSLYLVYLQIFVIHAICQYCMLSALTSTLIFISGLFLLKNKKIELN
ncbi:vitamin K epoxide reductase family protein [Patescibacteria group bacterium]|nr:vitamin K epoxide reductase family protein [Patescibacteria group bacterium]